MKCPNYWYQPFKRKLPFLRGRARAGLLYGYSFIKYLNQYIDALNKRKRGEKFLIVCVPRTGSSLLGELVGANQSRVKWDIEYQFVSHFRPDLLAEANVPEESSKYFGVKFFLHKLHSHLTHTQLSTLLGRFTARNWKLISLTRRNVVRHALSIERFRRGGSSYQLKDSDSKDDERRKIKIDYDTFEYILKWCDRFRKFQRKALANTDHASVKYEDFKHPSDRPNVVRSLSDYLGVPLEVPEIYLTKQSSSNLRDEVHKYNKFVEAVKRAGYEQYIDNEG